MTGVTTVYLHFVPGSHHRAPKTLGTFGSGKNVFNNTNESIHKNRKQTYDHKGDSEVGERQIRSMALSDTNHYTLWETGRTEEETEPRQGLQKKFVIIDTLDAIRHETLGTKSRGNSS